MEPTLDVSLRIPTARDMYEFGQRLAGSLRAGDLVLLTGELGAGKTTLTRGIGAGLRVRGEVTSPTFVIAREHPSLHDGPALVHVDAYRLGGLSELDDLDLDASLSTSVTVVEWGAGLVEGLAEDRLEVLLTRPQGMAGSLDRAERADLVDTVDAADGPGPEVVAFADDEPRVVRLLGHGARWRGVQLAVAVP